MSHFTVLVVGDDFEGKLAPFQENNMGDCPKEYLQFNDTEEEHRNDYAENTRTFWQAPDGTRYSTLDDRFKVKDPNGIGTKFVRPDEYKEVKVPFKEIYSTFEEYMDDYCEEQPDSQTGKYGYWKNPNAKWDWYQIGGRWAGFFKLKEGASGEKGTQSWMQIMHNSEYPSGKADQAFKGDIDFQGMREESRAEAAVNFDKLARILGGDPMPIEYTWKQVCEKFIESTIDEKRKIYFEQEPLKLLEEKKNSNDLSKDDKDFITWLEYEDYAVGREEYIMRAGRGAISTFAIVKDGKWYTKGNMGWWGIVSDKKDEDKWDEEYEKLLNELPDDVLLTVVDCHI